MKKNLQKLVLFILVFNHESFSNYSSDTEAERDFRNIWAKSYRQSHTEHHKKYLAALSIQYFKAKFFNEKSQLLLGRVFNNKRGRYIAQNFHQAYYWFTKAAEQGEASAYGFLSLMYSEGCGREKNLKKSFDFAKIGADKNDLASCLRVASCYVKGQGTPINKQQAIDYYTKAADLGRTDLYVSLGLAHYYGKGVPVNKERAIIFYKQAVSKEYCQGYTLLGRCYVEGQGVEKDVILGSKYLKKAENRQ